MSGWPCSRYTVGGTIAEWPPIVGGGCRNCSSAAQVETGDGVENMNDGDGNKVDAHGTHDLQHEEWNVPGASRILDKA
jgi:hypothetical protein